MSIHRGRSVVHQGVSNATGVVNSQVSVKRPGKEGEPKQSQKGQISAFGAVTGVGRQCKSVRSTRWFLKLIKS